MRTHGTRSCYAAGCRCDLCRAAETHYRRLYRAGAYDGSRWRWGMISASPHHDRDDPECTFTLEEILRFRAPVENMGTRS